MRETPGHLVSQGGTGYEGYQGRLDSYTSVFFGLVVGIAQGGGVPSMSELERCPDRQADACSKLQLRYGIALFQWHFRSVPYAYS